ncbi:MAG: PilN domain-containing protein [Phycisphaerae bacterium]
MIRANPRPPSNAAPPDARRCARVNLLPASARLRAAERRRRRSWTLLSAGLVVCAGAGWGAARSFSSETRALRTQTARVQHQIRDEERRIHTLLTQLEQVRQRAAMLARARASESWSARLAELAAALPEHAVLARLQVTSPANSVATPAAPSGGAKSGSAGGEPRDPAAAALAGGPPAGARVQLDGYAADHAAIARFLQRLEDAGGYRGVRLVRSTSEAGGALLFGVECWR